MSVYYDVYLHHKFLSFHLGERKKMKKITRKKEKRERDRENVEGKEKDEEERAQRLHLFLLVSSKRSPRSRHDDQVHIQVQNKVGTYQPYKALFTTK
jgi:hypothetical protein